MGNAEYPDRRTKQEMHGQHISVSQTDARPGIGPRWCEVTTVRQYERPREHSQFI